MNVNHHRLGIELIPARAIPGNLGGRLMRLSIEHEQPHCLGAARVEDGRYVLGVVSPIPDVENFFRVSHDLEELVQDALIHFGCFDEVDEAEAS